MGKLNPAIFALVWAVSTIISEIGQAAEPSDEKRSKMEDNLSKLHDDYSLVFLSNESYYVGYDEYLGKGNTITIYRQSLKGTISTTITCTPDDRRTITISGITRDGKFSTEDGKNNFAIEIDNLSFEMETAMYVNNDRNHEFWLTSGSSFIETTTRQMIDRIISGARGFSLLDKISGERLQFLTEGLDDGPLIKFREGCYGNS